MAVLVIAEHDNKQLKPGVANTVAAAAKMGGEVSVLVAGHQCAAAAQEILDHLGAELPLVTDWSGTVGVGIASSNVEYFDEPALAVMLCELPADQYRVFSGVAPLGLGFEPYTALVHADSGTPDVAELIAKLKNEARVI